MQKKTNSYNTMTKTDIILTKQEIARIYSLYPSCKVMVFGKTAPKPDKLAGIDFISGEIVLEHSNFAYEEVKLVLKPLEYITDSDLRKLCHAYDNVPFAGTMPDEWRIRRDSDLIRVEHKKKLHNYSIDLYNGNVALYREGKTSNLGRQVNVMQWLQHHYYTFPLNFGCKHEANGKTPIELGLAVPDRSRLTELLNEVYSRDKDDINSWFADKQLFGVDLHDMNVYRQVVNDLSTAIKRVK